MVRPVRQMVLRIYVVISLTCFLWTLFMRRERVGPSASKLVSTMETAIKLNELTSPGQFVKIEPSECVQMKHFAEVQICIKPIKKDKWISGSIKEHGAWEYEIVQNVLQVLSQFTNATFLDLGCNIGMYTVVVAALNHSVVAVDADPVNLAYIRTSTDMGNTTSNVRLVHNSVSNVHETLYTVLDDPTNEGATRLMSLEELRQTKLKATGPPLQSVTLMDILRRIPADTVIIKIDIEGYECKALQPDILLGNSGKYIPYIFIEWFQLPKNNVTCPEYKKWVDLFYRGGYSPLDIKKLQPLKTSVKAAYGIAWVHGSVHR